MKIFAVLKEIKAIGKETRTDFPCGVKARCVKVLTKREKSGKHRDRYTSRLQAGGHFDDVRK